MSEGALERRLLHLEARVIALEAFRGRVEEVPKAEVVSPADRWKAYQEAAEAERKRREAAEAVAVAARPTGDMCTAEEVEADKASWMLDG